MAIGMTRLASTLAPPLFAAILGSAAGAQEVMVDVELVLAVDVSKSMDSGEQALQRQGYVDAFRHPDVIQALSSGPNRKIAAAYVEWSSPGFRSVVVPWMVLAGPQDAERFASALEQSTIARDHATSISSGLYVAAAMFEENGYAGVRQAIDISGDGPNNAGYPVDVARDQIAARGITINGLPIMVNRVSDLEPYSLPNLDIYYRDCVIGGPGAFLITVDDETNLERAIRRKLVLEIAGLPPRIIPAAVVLAQAPGTDCMIGEKAANSSIQR
jgi:hypothetical protein